MSSFIEKMFRRKQEEQRQRTAEKSREKRNEEKNQELEDDFDKQQRNLYQVLDEIKHKKSSG